MDINKLEILKREILEIGKSLVIPSGNLYYFDLYCIAQLNRSLNIIDGFIDLVKKDNFISAFPLLRLHLDTLQRMHAFQLIDKNVDEIVKEILKGKSLNKFQHKVTKEKLTDAVLVRELGLYKNFYWVKAIYSAGNDFIHFSSKHIFSSTIIENKDDLKMISRICYGSPMINQDEKEGAIIYMGKITEGILFFIKAWIEQKKTYPNIPL